MRAIIICNTFYQLMAAIQIRNTIKEKDYVCLLLSDHSKNTEEIAIRLRNEKIFDEVHFVKTKKFFCVDDSIINKILNTIRISFSDGAYYNSVLQNIPNCCFDEIISYNFSLDIDSFYSFFCRFNSDIRASRFEEGLFSYGDTSGFAHKKKRTIVKTLRNLQGKKSLLDVLTKFYCFYPNLYTGQLNPVAIPLVKKNSKTRIQLNNIFNLRTNECQYYQKYIFFTSIYDFEGGKPVGEFELVNKIADLVGKENLLVKTHPRDIRTIYQDNGFNVDKNSSIPWEAIQLSGDFSDKVFLTINSGSVLSGSTMSENPVRTYFLYKLCDISGNPSCQKNAVDIEKLLNNEKMKNIFKSVRIAEKLEDIL